MPRSKVELFAATRQGSPLTVLLATFGSLRWGEVSALRRRDVDPMTGAVRIRAAYSERSTGELILGPPKSAAGVRAVTVPTVVAEELSRHLDEFVAPRQDALLFAGLKGQPVRRSNFGKAVDWTKTVADLGHPGLHFHDLRHRQPPGGTNSRSHAAGSDGADGT